MGKSAKKRSASKAPRSKPEKEIDPLQALADLVNGRVFDAPAQLEAADDEEEDEDEDDDDEEAPAPEPTPGGVRRGTHGGEPSRVTIEHLFKPYIGGRPPAPPAPAPAPKGGEE